MASKRRLLDSIKTKFKYSSMAILFFILLLSGVAVVFIGKLTGQIPLNPVFLVIAFCVEIAGISIIAVFGYLRLPRSK